MKDDTVLPQMEFDEWWESQDAGNEAFKAAAWNGWLAKHNADAELLNSFRETTDAMRRRADAAEEDMAASELALRTEALRYQFLRDGWWLEHGGPETPDAMAFAETPEQFDAAVDAAMSAARTLAASEATVESTQMGEGEGS